MTIDDLAVLGDGVAHDDKGAIFVAGALTGERVWFELEPSQESPRRGRLLEVLKPSPARATPPCPHFPLCGGCQFQHMKLEAYQNHKLGHLLTLLERGGLHLEQLEPAFFTTPGTRRRARLAAKRTKSGVTLGFNAWHSHDLIDVQACPVLLPRLVTFIGLLRDKLSLWLPRQGEADIQLTLLPDGLDVLMIGGPALDLDARQDLGALAEALDVAHLSWRKNDRSPIEPIAHRKPLGITFGQTTLPFPAGSFLQASGPGEQALVTFAQEAMQDGLHVLDLFSGLGTFGLSMSGAKKVHFVDIDGPAMAALAAACRMRPHDEVTLRNLMKDPFSTGDCNDFDLVIFDPPRGGAKAQAAQLARSDVPNIIAISCDPVSFVRDAQLLINGGYKLKRLLPVDQFLWSSHLELAAHFTR